MPNCVECKHEGKYFELPVPFPADVLNLNQDARRYGFGPEDLTAKGMHFQAPGGGPTKDPIVLFQAMVSQRCDFYVSKTTALKHVHDPTDVTCIGSEPDSQRA